MGSHLDWECEAGHRGSASHGHAAVHAIRSRPVALQDEQTPAVKQTFVGRGIEDGHIINNYLLIYYLPDA